ncbi:MAG: PSD1 and planctomycete cytochrome C domain-containing protein [Akkermansiaceae bacterium]|nr:PSD1 and planctomycete cytochrome C domain-containing protein [Akkermansiaceae bacterium]
MPSLKPRSFLLFLLIHCPLALPAEIDFNAQIRPLLTKNCTTCHGGVKKAGDVSFLYREDVLGKGKSGRPVVVPGSPADSEMIRRLKTSDPDDRMPPPDHHPEPIATSDIAILEQWVAEGAEWGDHWAFVKPQNPGLPSVEEKDWAKAGLDRFVLAKLEQKGLAPSPPASPEAWLRRVTLDLTGLPPTLAEFEAFSTEAAGDLVKARETVVDRLLASPAYGEHLTAMWLDLARYSDTFGFEKDPHRNIWPYRDWVIEAFNKDLPFDQFTIKQLAGDLIEKPSPDDLIASSFHRNTQNNTEGGTDDEEWRMAAVMDRVSTTWTAWNGTTFACVQCHSHPYEPIPHEDYYRFLAFFNNSEDIDQNDDFPKTKVAKDPAQQEASVNLEKGIRNARAMINKTARELAQNIEDWSVIETTESIAQPDTGKVTQQKNGDILSSGTNPTRAIFKLTAPAPAFGAIRLTILPLSDDPANWDEQGAIVSGIEMALVGRDGSRKPVPLREVVADYLAGPYDPNDSLKKGASGFGEFPMMKGPRTAWIVPNSPATPDAGEKLEITIRHGAVCNGNNQNCVLRRFRLESTGDPRLVNFLASPERDEAWKQLATLKQQYKAIPGMTIPVMQERLAEARRETRLFIRGNRMTLGQVVAPGVPEIFGGNGKEKNRLDMARWLVGRENPLAARVLANRLWASMFGVGIVETLEDFGSSGTLPTHPELLDFLALRLRDHHRWHLKPFLREIALSATYGQDNKATSSLLQTDPKNRLLARGPRQRLSAEMVRDQALVISGLLTTKNGGPPVYPPQPDGIWRSVYNGQTWKTSTGPDRYRRAIYTYRKRTSGYPAFLTFDAPTGDVCSARRIATNTPLQALVTLNDPAHIEFAQALAKVMSEHHADLSAQLSHGWKRITLQDPDPETLDTLVQLHRDAMAELQKTPDDSARLANEPSLAALVIVANTILNSDAALNR